MSEIEDLLAEIEAAIQAAAWRMLETPPHVDHDVWLYEGIAGRWRVVATSFEIESQGFPPGSRGYDGAATREGIVVRLTRDLAEKSVRLAEKAGASA